MRTLRRWWARVRRVHPQRLGDGHPCQATYDRPCPECGWQLAGWLEEER